MEEVTVGLPVALARRLECLSTDHGPGYMDHLLDTCQPYVECDKPPPEPLPIDEWIPKIAIDAVNKSVEIDVGSQVVVVNLADFYKKRDAAQLLGSRPDGGALAGPADPAASGLHLLAATATQESGAGSGPRFTCIVCHAVSSSHGALRLHGAAAHCARLAVCRRCGLSFLSQRELDRHPCEEERRERQEQKARQEEQERLERQRVPPLVLRPPKSDRVRRLEDTSSDDSDEAEEPPRRRPSPPPQSRPVARRQPPPPPAPRPAPTAAAQSRRPGPPNPNGKKEAYVCRVCHSKFRDPKSVLSHLKQFHPEHARKAWSKFQDNLKHRQSGAGPAPPPPAVGRGGGGGGGDSTFAVRSVAPMKLKLSRSAQQQRLQPPPPRRPPSPPAPSSEPAGPPSPGFVTCGVCGGTKYYTHTARCRLDGSYACEPCRKFVGRLAPHQPLQCLLGLGRCHVPAVAPRHSTEARCRACWLKKCLVAFNMPAERHDKLRALLPPSIARDVLEAAHKPFQKTGRCELDES